MRSSDEKTLLAVDSDRLGRLQYSKYMGEDAFALHVFSPVWQESAGPCTQPTRSPKTPCSKPLVPPTNRFDSTREIMKQLQSGAYPEQL
jgi:hypothetical protein